MVGTQEPVIGPAQQVRPEPVIGPARGRTRWAGPMARSGRTRWLCSPYKAAASREFAFRNGGLWIPSSRTSRN